MKGTIMSAGHSWRGTDVSMTVSSRGTCDITSTRDMRRPLEPTEPGDVGFADDWLFLAKNKTGLFISSVVAAENKSSSVILCWRKLELRLGDSEWL